MRYEVQPDGSLNNGKIFFDMTSAPGEDALDGMKVDKAGNLYVSGPGGLWILSPEGKHLGTIIGPNIRTISPGAMRMGRRSTSAPAADFIGSS